MAIVKKLTKHGNSAALIIDKNLLELMGADMETLFELSMPDGQTLVISPVDHERKKRFEKSLDTVHKYYGDVLNRLAK